HAPILTLRGSLTLAPRSLRRERQRPSRRETLPVHPSRLVALAPQKRAGSLRPHVSERRASPGPAPAGFPLLQPAHPRSNAAASREAAAPSRLRRAGSCPAASTPPSAPVRTEPRRARASSA